MDKNRDGRVSFAEVSAHSFSLIRFDPIVQKRDHAKEPGEALERDESTAQEQLLAGSCPT